MRSLMILVVGGLLMVGSYLVTTPPAPNRADAIDHSSDVAARYHYRNRRGSIYRR